MNRFAVALLISVVVAGNAVTIALLVLGRESSPASGVARIESGEAALAPLLEAMAALREDVDRLSRQVAVRSADSAVPVAGTTDAAEAEGAIGAPAGGLDEVLERLRGLEKTLAAMKDVNDELAAARLREMRQEQFRAEDGFALADELLQQKQFAVGANGVLTFLEAHPDHPDARDLMRKARDAFLQAGYGEKALWLQDEIMKKFPGDRGAELYSLAMLEKQLRKPEDALRHINEAVELAATDQDRMNRMFYRAFLLHQRDGDEAGLQAYREVERLSRAVGYAVTGDEAGKRATEIEGRLPGR